MIIDCHCHAGIGDALTGPWDTRAPLHLYLRRADAAGIGKTVLFPAFHSDYAAANAALARIVANGGGRFVGFAFVDALRDRYRLGAMLATAVYRYGFRGIKVHRHDARIRREVCAVALEFSVPVFYDPVGDVSAIDLLGEEYPQVAFIIPHLGSFADDWRVQRAFLAQLERYPNIYTDTAGVRRFDLLVEAVDRGGPHKVLFGTDGPWLHPGVELAKIRALELAPHDERLVVAGNILRLIGDWPTATSASRPAPVLACASGRFPSGTGACASRAAGRSGPSVAVAR